MTTSRHEGAAMIRSTIQKLEHTATSGSASLHPSTMIGSHNGTKKISYLYICKSCGAIFAEPPTYLMLQAMRSGCGECGSSVFTAIAAHDAVRYINEALEAKENEHHAIIMCQDLFDWYQNCDEDMPTMMFDNLRRMVESIKNNQKYMK